MIDNVISVTENGETKSYTVYGFLENKERKKNYIIYTDGENYYASSYILNGNKMVLDEITDDTEWDYIDKELAKNG